MNGILLRLAGPLQSWGEHSSFGERDTCQFPTRSGLLGLFAAAQGRKRTSPLTDFDDVQITIRIDRPGIRLVDFHTVGGGYPRHLTVPTAEGKRRAANAATIVSRRHYLADAAFTVAVTAPPESQKVLDQIAKSLAEPVWPPYLGRRSCPPDAPYLLRTGVSDPVDELHQSVPLDNPLAGDPVTFVTEQFDGTSIESAVVTELNDVPISFHSQDRQYRSRQVILTRHILPADLYPTTNTTYFERLAGYLSKEAS